MHIKPSLALEGSICLWKRFFIMLLSLASGLFVVYNGFSLLNPGSASQLSLRVCAVYDSLLPGADARGAQAHAHRPGEEETDGQVGGLWRHDRQVGSIAVKSDLAQRGGQEGPLAGGDQEDGQHPGGDPAGHPSTSPAHHPAALLCEHHRQLHPVEHPGEHLHAPACQRQLHDVHHPQCCRPNLRSEGVPSAGTAGPDCVGD